MNKKIALFVLALTLTAVIVAACAPAATPAPTTAPPTAAAAKPTTGATASGKLEIFSWWTTGGEAAGLAGMFDLYKKQNPSVDIVNATVAGGAGSNAQAVLKTRMLGGDPPDSFQVHMGHELVDTWVTPADKMEDLSDLFAKNGFNTAFPKGVLDIVSYNGKPYSVPVNIHRANVLWYNKKVFADNKLDAPKTFDDFFKAADALKAKGITPLAVGDNGPWASGQVFETVLIGTLGADGYNGLWTGKTAWTDSKVTDALNTFKKMMGYVNTDHAALSWDQANDLVISGKAAMTIMGDWIDGDYTAKKFPDYGWVAAPGNDGIFDALSDTFGLPKGAKNRDNALKWLALAGSKEGQEAFNPKKGSICARTDCNPQLFDTYLQSAIKDWQANKIVPSLEHGAAAKPGWVTSFSDAVTGFIAKGDVAATQKALAQACVDATVCK